MTAHTRLVRVNRKTNESETVATGLDTFRQRQWIKDNDPQANRDHGWPGTAEYYYTAAPEEAPKKTRPAAWTPAENAAVIRLYFDMLGFAVAGQKYNKAGMIRSYQASDEGKHPEALHARSRGSIEAKLMNASAAHRDLDGGITTMDGYGYRCLSNYQAALKDAMREAIAKRCEATEQRLGRAGSFTA